MNQRVLRTIRSQTVLGVLLVFLAASTISAQAQTYSVPVGTSGTLTYQYEIQNSSCGGIQQTSAATWDDFTYTPTGGTAISLNGSIWYVYPCSSYQIDGGWDYNSNDNSSDDWSNELSFSPALMIGDQACSISFYAAEFNPVGEASSSCVNPSILYPKYKVASIIYDAPGNESSNGYGTSITDGSSTSIGSNFETGTSTTFSAGVGFFGLGGTLSVTFSSSETTGNNSAFTETFIQGSGVANASSGSAPNSINHDEDMFVIWLNPAISIFPLGEESDSYGIGTQEGANGQPEPVDLVEVYAQDMIGTDGHTTIPLGWLTPQPDPANNYADDLPGLASVCANPLPPEQCTQTNQCGCQPSDFTNILAQDPLLNYSSTTNPMNADVSGPAACGDDAGSLSTPSPDSECRYLAVPSQPGSSIQLTEPLVGPACSTCNIPVNNVTLSDSSMATQTYSQSFSQGVAYTWKAEISSNLGWGGGSQFNWTDTESSGAINGNANTMNATFKSSTVDCVQQIAVFYDTVYHTFVFLQPSDDSSCP